tara:strand:+ start:2172 stop:3899 length:1728 start_codon:yes stop_codon:yes gene_type:complete
LQLTTPEAKGYDTVFPGENWFFFWRTSPSLWESKLSEFQGPSPIFVPIFWGLHNESPDVLDFGNYRPETDLKRLYDCAQKVGKELVFLLPLSPAPFLPNGGLPSYLARNLLVDERGLAVTVLDNDGRLNKLYSFYDPRVFQAFRGFCNSIARYLSENAIACEVFGANASSVESGRVKSYFNDHSTTFNRGFDRYLAQLAHDGELDKERVASDPSEVERLKKSYSNQIQSLYEQAAKESLSANWAGELNFAFLGGASSDIFERTSEHWEHPSSYLGSLLGMTTLDFIPSSVLLSPGIKNEPLLKALGAIVSEPFIRSHMQNELYDEEYSSKFNPIVFFELYRNSNPEAFLKDGLVQFLERQYAWTFRFKRELKVNFDEEFGDKVRFFKGEGLDSSEFQSVIKLFMNGSKIFLDLSGMNEDLVRRLDTFVLENSLKEEKINYVSPVSKITLGEGVIITYSSEKLNSVPLVKKLKFWETLVSYFNIRHLDIETDEDGVFYFWHSRPSNAYELSYEEIRRVSLYNTTSYKKKAKISGAKNFAFLKTVDQQKVEVRSTPIGIEVQLLPGGSVSLDFGFYE